MKNSEKAASAQGSHQAPGEPKKSDPKKNEAAPEPIIQLHKPCLSCAGPTSMILDLYKVACLAYAPSPVEVNGVVLPREYCLDQQYALLRSTQEAYSCLQELQGSLRET